MEEKRHQGLSEKTRQATFRGELTASGRVTIPKPVRKSLDLKEGESIIDVTVEVVERDK